MRLAQLDRAVAFEPSHGSMVQVHHFVSIGMHKHSIPMLRIRVGPRTQLICDSSSMAELQPSKLATRVRFPSIALGHKVTDVLDKAEIRLAVRTDEQYGGSQ